MLSKLRFLVIEDELSLLKIIALRLKEEGYIVDTARNGKEGKDYIDAFEYDCIILDLMIPIIDGLTLLKEIRAKKVTTPVLILTAKDSIKDRVIGLDTVQTII